MQENVLDASHVPYTHHATISNRNVIGDYDVALTSDVTPAGFTDELVWAGSESGGCSSWRL